MSDFLDSLYLLGFVRECCRVDHAQDLLKHKAALTWAAEIFQGNKEGRDRDFILINLMLAYIEQNGRTPDDLQAFRNFISGTERPEGAVATLDLMDDFEASPENKSEDIDFLVGEVVRDVRGKWHEWLAQKYSMIATGLAKVKGKTGPDIARDWLSKRWTVDLATQESGKWLHESESLIKEELIKDLTKDRIFTGFRSIDRDIIITKKINPLWVIPGFAHEGKSTILTSLMYEFVTQGLKIAYFSAEHELNELLARMAFLHAYKFKKEQHWVLPSANQWHQGRREQVDVDRMNFIVDDMMKLPGRIKVFKLETWDDMMSVLLADKYDVCAVDYLSIMDTPGIKAQYRDEEIKRLIGEASKLTDTYNNGEGIIFITPAQINREGKKSSLKAKDGEKKYDMTAIAKYSELYQHADFIWSLFSDDDMKAENKWLLEVHKVKGYPPPWYPVAVLSKDITTDHVRETVGTSGGYVERSPLHHWNDDKSADDLTQGAF
jgi:DnaB-like helicase C terminal domain